MKRPLNLHRLRTRLILAYAGLIVGGFSVLAVLVGQQISTSAYVDYEQKILSEVLLISQGLQQPCASFLNGTITEADLLNTMNQYEDQIGGKLALRMIKDDKPVFISRIVGFESIDPRSSPEFGAATHGRVALSTRVENGEERIYTAAPIVSPDRQLLGYVHLSVPSSSVAHILLQRWGVLGLAVLGITSVALLVGVWLSSSLTRPLDKLRLSAVEIAKGNLTHRVADAGSDEIGEVANAFNQMAGQIQSMIEEQRAFASNASHELKTPLTTIRLRTEALRNDPELGSDIKDRYIAEIDDETTRLSSLVEDLILLSRFDAGRVMVGQDRVELGRFARNFNQQVAQQAAQKNITFTLDLPGESEIFIEANLNHLSVLFRNLLDNAVKYTPPGGTITWSIAGSGNSVRFTIRDSGQGISPHDLPHIFERFYRADKAHSRTVPGTGLGLALVQAIVDTYGATIQMHSDGEGTGTTVTLDWPLKDLSIGADE